MQQHPAEQQQQQQPRPDWAAAPEAAGVLGEALAPRRPPLEAADYSMLGREFAVVAWRFARVMALAGQLAAGPSLPARGSGSGAGQEAGGQEADAEAEAVPAAGEKGAMAAAAAAAGAIGARGSLRGKGRGAAAAAAATEVSAAALAAGGLGGRGHGGSDEAVRQGQVGGVRKGPKAPSKQVSSQGKVQPAAAAQLPPAGTWLPAYAAHSLWMPQQAHCYSSCYWAVMPTQAKQQERCIASTCTALHRNAFRPGAAAGCVLVATVHALVMRLGRPLPPPPPPGPSPLQALDEEFAALRDAISWVPPDVAVPPGQGLGMNVPGYAIMAAVYGMVRGGCRGCRRAGGGGWGGL
jgi:hypothetical protein